MDQTSLWWIWKTVSRKFQKVQLEEYALNWMRRILQANQRLKRNHKEENLPALHQEQLLLRKELGPMLKQGNIQSPILKYRRNWFIFFVMDNMYIEKMMELFNSGELKKIFRNISHIVLIGLTASGRKAWQEEEETRKDTSTVLILQEQLCISELFKNSWVRISHGLIKLVTDLSNDKEDDNNVQETSEMQSDNFLRWKSNVLALASRSKAKAWPQRRISASPSTRTLPIGERKWTDVEPEDHSPVDCSVSKKLINLLRHGDLPREEDGAIEFWRLKDYFRNDIVHTQHWSDEMLKS